MRLAGVTFAHPHARWAVSQLLDAPTLRAMALHGCAPVKGGRAV